MDLITRRDGHFTAADLVDELLRGFAADAMQTLLSYPWPGNIRELEHTIERAVALERTDTIQPESLPQGVTNYNPARHAPTGRSSSRS